MAEGWTTKRTSSELNVDLSTLQRWRKAGSGPAWRYNRDGECIYLASSVREWGSTHVDNPWEKDPEMAGQHVVSQRPATTLRTEAIPDFPRPEHNPQTTYRDAEDASLAREIAKSNFTLPERKPKHVDVSETPEWLKNLKK